MNATNEAFMIDRVSRAMLRAADAWAQAQIGLGLGLRPSPADCPIDVLARAAIDEIDTLSTKGAK
jgi:hypothetical protein